MIEGLRVLYRNGRSALSDIKKQGDLVIQVLRRFVAIFGVVGLS